MIILRQTLKRPALVFVARMIEQNMRKLHLEVIYAGDQNLCCYYMAEAVKSAASAFENELKCSIVDIFKKEGARRFYELSVMLYGEENVRKNHRHAPIPSIFIDDKLVFRQIPPVEILTEVIRRMSSCKNKDMKVEKLQIEGNGIG